MLGIHPTNFIVREFLNLKSTFTAFAGYMPINKERRYFVDEGLIKCHHPYWPESAFNNHPERMANDPDWKKKLRELNREDEEEIRLLSFYSNLVTSSVRGHWSIDYAQAVDGTWYLIDMALGNNSWHMKHENPI
jgi:hypothetical protein